MAKVTKKEEDVSYILELDLEEVQAVAALVGKCCSTDSNKWGQAANRVFNTLYGKVNYRDAYNTLTPTFPAFKFGD